MSKLTMGILSAFLLLAGGIIGVYVPNALASATAPPPPTIETCNGNIAAGQQGSSEAEQEIEQGQAGDTGAQSVSPEFNALTGNNLELQGQQNGECERTLGQPPVGDLTRSDTP
jgi:hypothetical protein